MEWFTDKRTGGPLELVEVYNFSKSYKRFRG